MNQSMSFILRREGLPDVTVSAEIYFADLRRRAQAVIGTVEQICYTHEGGRDKSLWCEYTLAQFNSLRKRILDIADEVGELKDRIILIDQGDSPFQKHMTDRQDDSLIASLFLRGKV